MSDPALSNLILVAESSPQTHKLHVVIQRLKLLRDAIQQARPYVDMVLQDVREQFDQLRAQQVWGLSHGEMQAYHDFLIEMGLGTNQEKFSTKAKEAWSSVFKMADNAFKHADGAFKLTDNASKFADDASKLAAEKASKLADDASKLTAGASKFADDHPYLTGAVGGAALIGGSCVLAPAALVGGLGVIGFGAAGPVAGSIAAGVQAGVYGGVVAAGSPFALAQAAAMGGVVVASAAELAAAAAAAGAGIGLVIKAADATRVDDREMGDTGSGSSQGSENLSGQNPLANQED